MRGSLDLTRGVARLHGSRTSYKLKVADAHRVEAEALLAEALGAPTRTRKTAAKVKGTSTGVLPATLPDGP